MSTTAGLHLFKNWRFDVIFLYWSHVKTFEVWDSTQTKLGKIDIISDYNKYCPKISESEKVGENKAILQTVSWKELFYKACVPQAPDTVTWAVCLSCTFTLFYVISF